MGAGIVEAQNSVRADTDQTPRSSFEHGRAERSTSRAEDILAR
jgi:hypothetical protein